MKETTEDEREEKKEQKISAVPLILLSVLMASEMVCVC